MRHKSLLHPLCVRYSGSRQLLYSRVRVNLFLWNILGEMEGKYIIIKHLPDTTYINEKYNTKRAGSLRSAAPPAYKLAARRLVIDGFFTPKGRKSKDKKKRN